MWGATYIWLDFVTKTSFNPRTRVGCDFWHFFISGAIGGFNPRTRVGCDPKLIDDYRQMRVSIHAPVWGATFVQSIAPSETWGFNPRTRVGCDCLTTHDYFYHQEFQSTHPCGVRLKCPILIFGWLMFQSTHPCGVRRPSRYAIFQ